MRKHILAALAASCLAASAASAGEIVDRAAEAEKLAGSGMYMEALDSLAAAQAKVWEQAPLTVRRAVFVASDPGGFGIYDVRENSVFKPGETLIVYAEPVGFGYKEDGSINVIDIAVDVELKNKEGVSIGAKQDFGRFTLRSRVKNREFMAKLSYDFTGIEPGEYEVFTTLRDATTGKSGTFSLPFTVAP
jgi:hypothetical protein